MTSTFKLKFLTINGTSTYITIPYAKQTLLAADIKAAMEDLIDLEIIETKDGLIYTPEEAIRIDTTVTQLAV